MDRLKKQFQNPSAEYSLMPFWFLNDRLDRAELLRQMRDFKSKGIDGFVIHPRMGLPDDLEYMGDEFLKTVQFIVSEAKKLRMRVILYDEGMYPSGSAHGKVVEGNPEFAARGIRIDTPFSGKLMPGEELVCAFDVAVKPDGTPDYTRARQIGLREAREAAAGGRTVTAIVMSFTRGTIRGIHIGEDDGQPGAPAAADLLNPHAVARFIHVTYERYYHALRPYFGNTVAAIFTDEPSLLGRCADPNRFKPWTPGFLEEYLNGGNHAKDLLALWYDVGPDTGAKRQNYQRAISGRLAATYYGQLSAWCAAHGVALTGHPARSEDIGLLHNFQIPGQDIVWRCVGPDGGSGVEGPDSTAAKCASDCARHLGRRRNLSECFGCCGPQGRQWEFSAADMKWYMDWLFVRGANLLVPHAFLYSVRGNLRLNERPPDVGPNNLWWTDYGLFARYAKRMSWLMTGSRNKAPVAILCGGDHLPWRFARSLYQNQIEFNYLEESLFLKKTDLSGGTAAIARQRYSIVAVEEPENLSAPTINRLNAFIKGGGSVAVYNPGNRSLGLHGAKNVPNFDALPSVLDGDLVRDVTAPRCPGLRVSHIIKEKHHFYLFVNEGEEEIRAEMSVNAAGRLELWDPMSGKTDALPLRRIERGRSFFLLTLGRRESRIVYADPDGIPVMENGQPVETARIDAPFSVWTLDLPDGRQKEMERPDFWNGIDGLSDFSGTLIYHAQLDLKKLPFDGRILLDLGCVRDMAKVTVNGKPAGVRMWEPYEFDLTGLFPGKTAEVAIAVTNSIANRLSHANLPSGMSGPVTLRVFR